jgi:hypothetical protein
VQRYPGQTPAQWLDALHWNEPNADRFMVRLETDPELYRQGQRIVWGNYTNYTVYAFGDVVGYLDPSPIITARSPVPFKRNARRYGRG